MMVNISHCSSSSSRIIISSSSIWNIIETIFLGKLKLKQHGLYGMGQGSARASEEFIEIW